jgi:hypothetical protein
MAKTYRNIPPLTPQDEVRFWAKIAKGGPADCWPWTACINNKGYGFFGHPVGLFLAHRVAYAIANNGLPQNACVCHHCDNPLCCNPAHLWLGTLADNNHDMARKGRAATGDRHGSRLHPESLARGDAHGSKTHPESLPCGNRNGAHTHPESVRKGEAHGMAKLTDAIVREIRFFRANNLATCAELALRFGVGKEAITSIAMRRSWKHVS